MLKRIFRATSVTAIVFMALSMFSPVQAAEEHPSPERLSALAQGAIAPAPQKAFATNLEALSVNSIDSSSIIAASVSSNAKLQMVNSSGIGIAGLIYVYSTTGDFFRDGETDISGNMSFDLPNDTYEFGFIPTTTDTNTVVFYAATVANGTLTLDGLVGNVIGANAAKVGDIWKVTLPDTNFRLKLVHPTTREPLTNCHVNIFEADSNWNSINYVGGAGVGPNSKVGFNLTSGNYIGQIYPHGVNSNLVRSVFRIIVSGSTFEVSQASINITAEDGAFSVSPAVPNVSGTYMSESNPLVFEVNQGISTQTQKKDVNGNWRWQNLGGYSSTNEWAFNFTEAGQYRIIARPNNFDNLVESYSPVIWVNSSGKVSLTQDGSYTDTLTAVTIDMKTPNLKLTVVNPLNNDEPVAGGYAELFKIVNGNESDQRFSSINPGNPGIVGFNISEVGNYVVKVTPPEGNLAIPGLAAKRYQVNATSLENIIVSSGGVPVPQVAGRSVLQLATANVNARIYRPDGSLANSAGNRWTYVHVQKLNQWNNWDWINLGMQVDQNGYVSFRVDQAGTYRLRIEPYNDADSSVTVSTEFTVAAGQEETFTKKFGIITLNQPTLRVSVAAPGSPDSLLKNIGISVVKDGQWYDWFNTGNSGVAGISLTSAGNYVFDVHPGDALQGTNTKKSYKFTATVNSDGVVVATHVTAEGASITNGVVKLLLGLPTLTGTVKDPTGTTNQVNSQVYARNVQTGQDMWEYSTNTNQNGTWSMLLPAGTYQILAEAPWSTSQYGKSSPVGNVVVDSSGIATSVPGGYSANSFNIRLKNPTWSGTVKDPTGTSVIPRARVCLLFQNSWNCATADMDGKWALSMSDSFTSFEGTNPLIDIYDDYLRAYPFRRIEGVTAVTNALGSVGSTNRELRLQAANVQINVTASGSTKAPSNLWVTADRDYEGFLGGGSTDANGIVKMYIADLTKAFKVRIEVNGNPEISQNFASVMKTISLDSITAGTDLDGNFTTSIELPTPNFKFVVREPTDVGTVVPYTWVELFNGNDGNWLGGTSTDNAGFASFKLDAPTSGSTKSYTVAVNPAWNATTNFTRQSYAVTVDANGSIVSAINKTDQSSMRLQTEGAKSFYPLPLGKPSVTGTVVDPSDVGVANSWVVPMNAATNEYYWNQGVNSRKDGQMAMNLADGSYKLEANVPWGASGVTKSAKCSVTVAEGKISTGGDCVQGTTSKTVKLQLRLPNVKFTLKVDGTAIPNAYVSVGAGSWWTNAQSDANGVVSLFIDADAIRAANTWNNGAIRLSFWVDPPYGSSTMARWSCNSTENKPICKDLPDVPANGDYVGRTDSWTVEGVQPNTRLKVVVPGTSTPLPNSWVVVLAMDSHGNKWWLNGGNSGSDGYAAINIETATVFGYGYNKLVVEVNAPWNDRSRYATNDYTFNGFGYTFESLTALSSVSPALPNLTLKVKDSNNSDNRYGWYGVQEVDGSNNYVRWVGGYGLNDAGEGSVYLPANKRYKVTFYPGGGRAGVESTCVFTTNSATPVAVTMVSCDGQPTYSSAILDLILAGGNVSGTVTGPSNTPLAGAIVYANQPGAATEASAIITVTDSAGHYDLQLKVGQQWTIKVFPPAELAGSLGVKTVDAPFTPSGTNLTKHFILATA